MCLYRLADVLSLSGTKVIHSPTVDVPPLPSTAYRSFQYTITDSMSQMNLGLDNTLKDWVERSVLESLEFFTDPATFRKFIIFQGGGSVENQDPSGACDGLSFLIYLYYHVISNSII